MGGLSHGGILAVIAAFVVLAACASPTVDTSTPTFHETQYVADLEMCRGGTVLDVTLQGLGGVALGSVLGLAHGAYTGAFIGGSLEGAAVGAVVGGVVGVVWAAYDPIQKQEQSVRRCLSEKGYVLGS